MVAIPCTIQHFILATLHAVQRLCNRSWKRKQGMSPQPPPHFAHSSRICTARLARLLVLTLLGLPQHSQADDNWSLSGFASAGTGRVEDSNLVFMDYDADRWSFDSDSALGLHLRGNLAERLSLTAQIVSRGFNWDDTSEYEPELDWLFLSYQLDTEWRTRLGRMRTPHYLFSETVDVGYSYAWVRPPVDVYAPILSPFSNFDGADLAWVSDWRDIAIDVQLLGGTMHRSRDDLEIRVEPMLGTNVSLQRDGLTLRYGIIYDRTDIRVNSFQTSENLFRSASVYSPLFARIADSHQARDAWYRYQSLGLRWEHDELTAIAEAFDIKNTEDGYTNNANGWYASIQHRFGAFTPYVVAGAFHNEFNLATLKDIQASYSIVPAGAVPALDQLRAASVIAIDSVNYAQHTWTTGLRHELLPNTALKAEWQWFNFEDRTTGQLRQETSHPPDHTSALSLAVDVVF